MKKSIFAIVILLLFCGFLGFDVISALILFNEQEADQSGETSPASDTSVKDRETIGFQQVMKKCSDGIGYYFECLRGPENECTVTNCL